MDQNTIIFVCQHGAAKSIVAATYFNQLAAQNELNVRAIARGTNPDSKLSEATVAGLSIDGLILAESTPQQLSLEDLHSAQRIVSFCELSDEYKDKIMIEQWDDVPPVSENYDKARDAIIEYLNVLITNIRSSS